VRNPLGNPQPFAPQGDPLSERPELGMARGQVGTAAHGGQVDLTEALVAPLPRKGSHGLLEAVDRPSILTLGLVDAAEMGVR
jgi:hypothetical protein